MKALSLTQPWAWLVVHGGKRIENRVWRTHFRGRFLIHAAKAATEAQYAEARCFAREVGAWEALSRMPAYAQVERGGIVGVADLIDVLPPPLDGQLQRPSWRMAGQFGFVLGDVRPLPFLPCKGALSFWGNFELRDGKAVQL